MSRGPGRVQQAIMMAIRRGPRAITEEALRWRLYEENCGVGDVGDLPTSWNTRVRRAVVTLAKTSALKVEERELTTLEECVDHYPGKTHDVAVRKLRQELLPVLLEWSRDRTGPKPRYTEAQNEAFHAEVIPEDQNAVLKERWINLESQIRPVFAPQGPNELLLLICKGRFLFQGGGVNVPSSFRALVQQCCDRSLVSTELASQLHSFAREFFPDEASHPLRLKSLIHAFAHVPRRRESGPCTLKKETLHRLLKERKKFVESLPDFRGGEPRGIFSPEPKHSPFIHKLLDMSVFQRFSFLTE